MPRYAIGRYECEITGQGFQKASTGTMQLVLQFRVNGMIDPNDPNSLLSCPEGERKFYRAITEKTVDWVMDDLKMLGVETLESWAQLDPNADHPGFIDLSGRKVDMNCGSKKGNDGNTYDDWSISRGAAPGKPIEHAAKNEISALDRMFGKHLKRGAAAAPGRIQRSVPQPVAAGVADDDDIPF